MLAAFSRLKYTSSKQHQEEKTAFRRLDLKIEKMKRAKNIQDTIKEERREIYPAKYQNFYEATDLR